MSTPRVQRPHREIWIDLRAGQSPTVWKCTKDLYCPPEMSLSWLYTQAVGQEAGEQPCTGRSGAFDASSVSVTSVPWQPEGSPVSWGAQGWREGIAPPCSALVQPHLESWGQFWCLNRRRTSEHERVSRGGQPRWGRKFQNKRRIMLWFSLWYTDGMELKPFIHANHIQELIISPF